MVVLVLNNFHFSINNRYGYISIRHKPISQLQCMEIVALLDFPGCQFRSKPAEMVSNQITERFKVWILSHRDHNNDLSPSSLILRITLLPAIWDWNNTIESSDEDHTMTLLANTLIILVLGYKIYFLNWDLWFLFSEYVKNINSIYKYNCSRKNEFINKGLCKFLNKHHPYALIH